MTVARTYTEAWQPLKDACNSVLRYRSPAMVKTSLFIAIIYFMMTNFVETWIWDPVWTLFLLWGLIGYDLILGLMISVRKRKEGFQSRKALHFVFTITSYTVLLIGAHSVPKIVTWFGVPEEQSAMLILLPRLLYVYTFVAYILSITKNAVLLGHIKGKIARWIYKNFDTYKNDVSDDILEDIKMREKMMDD